MSPRKKSYVPDESPKLSPWDVLAITQAEHAVKLSEQNVRTLELEKANLESQHQVLMLRVKLTQDACDKKLADEKTRLAQGRAAAAKLSAQLAERHQFSWSTHSYNPDTGEIVAVGS